MVDANSKEAITSAFIDVLKTTLEEVTAHLIAAHSLLQRGGKKAAGSDTMFYMMLDDYQDSFERARAVLKGCQNAPK